MSRYRIKPLPAPGTQMSQMLERRLGWPQLIALGIGAIVGTGIYTMLGVGVERAGPAVILAFALAGIVCAGAAFAYAELATMLPHSGGAYAYSYVGYGEVVAWLVGWSLILEYSVACSAVGVGWSAYVVNALAASGIHLPQAITAGPHAGGIINLPAVLIVLAIAAVLLRGIQKSARLNAVLVFIKLAALGLFVLLALGAFRAENLSPFMPYGFLAHEGMDGTRGVLTAAAVVFFTFFGFDAVATAAEETKRPERNIAIGIIGSIVVCALIYIIVSAAAIGAVAFPTFAGDSAPLATVLHIIGHSWAAFIISGAAVVALPTVILVMMYGQTRLFFAMARDGLLPRSWAEIDSEAGVPRRVTLFSAALIAVVAGILPLGEIAELTNAGTLAALIAVLACVLVLRRRYPEYPRGFRYPLAWIFAPLTAIGCIYLLFSLPDLTLERFMIWNLIGVAVYFLFSRRRSELHTERPAATGWLHRVFRTMYETAELGVSIQYAKPWKDHRPVPPKQG